MNDNYDLKPVRLAMLEVYCEIVKICERHNLRQWVFFGTLLGAARHQGFIPWDDDIDMAMPRRDYEAFIRIAREELPSWLSWKSMETNSSYQLAFGKVVENRADVVEDVQRKSHLKLEQGIFIDVFPLDGLPSNDMLLFFWKVQRSIRRRLKMSSLSLQLWHAGMDFDMSERVGFAEESLPKKTRYQYRAEFFKETVQLPFEDITVSAPMGWEQILVLMFGNWRALPPEEKRVPSHQILG